MDRDYGKMYYEMREALRDPLLNFSEQEIEESLRDLGLSNPELDSHKEYLERCLQAEPIQ